MKSIKELVDTLFFKKEPQTVEGMLTKAMSEYENLLDIHFYLYNDADLLMTAVEESNLDPTKSDNAILKDYLKDGLRGYRDSVNNLLDNVIDVSPATLRVSSGDIRIINEISSFKDLSNKDCAYLVELIRVLNSVACLNYACTAKINKLIRLKIEEINRKTLSTD